MSRNTESFDIKKIWRDGNSPNFKVTSNGLPRPSLGSYKSNLKPRVESFSRTSLKT